MKTEEHRSLEKALALIRDAIAQVDMNVCDYKKVVRLREIGHRLEGRPLSRPKEPCVFRREELIQGGCSLLHEGTVTWRTSGKQKGGSLRGDVVSCMFDDGNCNEGVRTEPSAPFCSETEAWCIMGNLHQTEMFVRIPSLKYHIRCSVTSNSKIQSPRNFPEFSAKNQKSIDAQNTADS